MNLPPKPWRARHWALPIVLLALSWSAGAQPRIVVEKAADLPRFTYRIEGRLEDVVRQPERFAPLAAELRRNLDTVLAAYDIRDKGTQREIINLLALLDFLEGRYDSAIARADEVRALQEKPADKLLSLLRLRLMSQAAKAHGMGTEPYRRAVAEGLASALNGMPHAVIANDIREARAGLQTLGEALVLGPVREVMQPIASKSGALSSDFAPGLIGARFTLLATLPLKQTLLDVYAAYLAAHQVDKPDIWAEREATLPAGQTLHPVVLAVWDSGVDTRLFGDQVLRDAKGRVRVIGFDKYGRRADTELQPLPTEVQARLPLLAARSKGFSDLEANIDSAEAQEVTAFLSSLAPDRYTEAVEEIGLAGTHEHGTHVAGIAMAGNPHARLLVARMEFDHRLSPDPCPSRALALREAASYRDTVAFLKRHGARIVNMSWGGGVAGIESAMEQCGLGRSPRDRARKAREYFEISRKALRNAFAGAPGILFITAAGNSNDDPSFMEDIPAALVLPNLLTVGAVDRAGDEAGFTSYGPTVKVHANGYQVESFTPGGQRVAYSGTSMAAPQVANLAAKLLAVKPGLKPAEVIGLIVQTGERSADGRRHLMHPKKALEAARALP